MNRAVVIDDATGAVKRTLDMPPAMLALNVRPGEALFLLTDDTGFVIADAYLVVSETGNLVPSDAAPEGFVAPAYELQFIAV